MNFSGPGENFQLLFEEVSERTGTSISLPDPVKAIYGGDWIVPSDRQYRYSNFVISHDGKTSFSVLHHEGGGDISGFNRHDQWVMALTRARADAVTVGANTLRTEPNHIWSSEFIFPQESEAFAQLRLKEGRRPFPYQVMVTRSGELNADAAVFADSQLDVIVATTTKGAGKIRELGLSNVAILELGESDVDLGALHESLEKDFGVMTVLCEGGPKFYAAVIQARQIEEEFLTISPVVVGASSAEYRPGLIDGLALEPGNKFGVNLQSLRRAGNMLFLRSRY
ncbi:MAG: dihydrofolate reductase family protein [Candidatus Nanopelagicaceae bacterium]